MEWNWMNENVQENTEKKNRQESGMFFFLVEIHSSPCLFWLLLLAVSYWQGPFEWNADTAPFHITQTKHAQLINYNSTARNLHKWEE